MTVKRLFQAKARKAVRVEKPAKLTGKSSLTHCKISHCKITHCK